MKTKECTSCKTEKSLDHFGNNRRSKDGLMHACRSCRSEVKRKYRLANREKVSEGKKRWYRENRERVLQKRKDYYQENSEVIKERNGKHGKRPEVMARKNRRCLERYHSDIIYRLKVIVSRSVGQALKGQGACKKSPTWSALPYTPRELREHLEAQFDDSMTWENYGTMWHIDHIYPQSRLPYDSFDHPNFIKCWALENLQPLDAIENIRKGNKVYQ